MKILITGLPGSGKTTQAKKISEALNICLIKTGELLRELATQEDEIGQRVRQAVERGDLANDELVADLIKHKLEQAECANGFTMDGFPRSVEQLRFYDPGYEMVFYLNISPEEALKRLTARGRSDDTPEVIDRRMQIQARELDGLINYYKTHSHFVEIEGEQSVGEIFSQIMEVVNGQTKN